MLSKLSCDLSDTVLAQVEFAINNINCRLTQDTPSMFLFGKNQRGKVYHGLSEFLELENSQNDSDRDSNVLRHEAAQNIEQSQVANKIYYDKHHKACICLR